MKKTIKQLAAVAVVPVVGVTMGLNSTTAGAQVDEINKGIKAVGGSNSSATLQVDDIVLAVVNWLLFAVGVISVIMLIVGGIKYATSAGDSNKVTSAKNTIMYAIIGLAVAVLAFAIVGFVMNTLNGGTVQGPSQAQYLVTRKHLYDAGAF